MALDRREDLGAERERLAAFDRRIRHTLTLAQDTADEQEFHMLRDQLADMNTERRKLRERITAAEHAGEADVDSLRARLATMLDELAGTMARDVAAARAALSTMPADEMERLLKRPLKQITEKTLTDPVALRAEIDATRKRGWGQVREDLYLDVGGVAAVAPLHDDVLVGIGVSYPLHRTPARTVTAYGRMVRDAIAHIAADVKPLLQPAD